MLYFIRERCAVSGVVWADECPGINVLPPDVWASDSGGEFQSGEFSRRDLAAWQRNQWHGQQFEAS